MTSEMDYMLLSGIQHFAFCRRQWALIYIEQQWADNYFTVDGSIMHDKAHDPFFTEKRGKRIVSRAVPVRSERLHLPANVMSWSSSSTHMACRCSGAKGSGSQDRWSASAERRFT